MWFERKFYRYAIAIIAILLIIFLFGKINYFFVPIQKFIETLFFPFIFSGFLYYLLRPLVSLLVKFKTPKVIAIAIVFVLITALIVIGSNYTGAKIAEQGKDFASSIPNLVESGTNETLKFFNKNVLPFNIANQIKDQLVSFIGNIVPFITGSVVNGIGAIAGFASTLLLVPFILFYLLKDDEIFAEKINSIIPEKYKSNISEIFEDMDKTLSAYITAQVVVALIDGILMFIGYLIFGLQYSLILSIFVAITAFIPIIGAPLGVLPAILVGYATNGPFMCLKIIVLVIIVQQIEGNLVSPQLMGKRMKIHPLTFIVILLVAASLFGFVGMLVAVPFYAVLKVIIVGLYKLFKERDWKIPIP